MKTRLIEHASRLLHALLRTRPAAPPVASASANVLVIKPASLGDVLMSTAFLAALRANLPQADVTVLVTTWAKAALAGNPHCDRLLDAGSVGFPGRYGLRAYRACVARVRQEEFTHCFVLDRSPLMAVLPRLAGIPWRAGLNSAGRGIALHVGVPCPDERHEAEIYLDVLRAAGFGVERPRLHYRLRAEDGAAVKRLLAERDVTPAFPLIALHPGGGTNPGQAHVGKRWPSGSFAALAARIARAHGARILLVGGADEASITGAVQSGAPAACVDLAGALSFGQLGALIQRCHLFIGNDSAPMHLAAAVGTPVVALFGPTPPERYGPYGVESAVVRFNSSKGDVTDEREVRAAAAAVARLLDASA